MSCPLCHTRKPRRACPALNQTICAVCCGTKRLIEIQCPDDCVYLTSAREHPAWHTATIARYTRAEMLEHLPLDYVRTARSKGLKEQVVVLRHVLRNSLIPVVTLVALGVPAVFGGAIVTEQVFRVPGIGELLVSSIFNGDIPVVATVVFIFAVLVVAFNVIADLLYAVLDPRIRYT